MANSPQALKNKIQSDGYALIDGVFSPEEVSAIGDHIEQHIASKPTFLKPNDLFAIRQLLKEMPELSQFLFTEKIKAIIRQFFGEDYFIVKSIYFDKPALSNWFVAYHRDLTISVDRKCDLAGYRSWTNKQGQFAVQPPISILDTIFTLRIHLDDTDGTNGALRVIPGSHLSEYNEDAMNKQETEQTCSVKEGGVMLMRPLLLHASSRSASNKRRRVIHLEFSNCQLEAPLKWAEYMAVN